jgi:hypothetical protein
MKKTYWVLIIIILLILAWAFVRFVIGGSEDSWIKAETGMFVKHGYPSETPDYVLTQREAISKAKSLYSQKRAQGMVFNSQCLGVVGGYAVDIVNVPRAREDNNPENQCEAFTGGEASNFIELDKFGNVGRISD